MTLSLRLQVLTAVAALALTSAMVLRTSSAAFTAQTGNAANDWTAGEVILSDDDTGALFDALTGLVPGNTETDCIAVTYDGNVASTVRLYAAVTGTLGAYLTLDVDRGTAATFGDCGTFVKVTDVYDGKLSGFGTNWATGHAGATTWAPSSSETVAYRFTYTLDDDNLAQGLTAGATFTWEAQNS